MKHLAYAFAALFAVSSAALADTAQHQFRLLPGWTEADGTRIAALEVTLLEGWHTYWRAPGDAGVPPHFSWSGSQNLKTVTPRYPQPEVFTQDGIRTLGYHHTMILPFVVTPKNAGKPVKLKGTFGLGVCKDICIPIEVQLEALLPVKAAQSQPAIKAALAREPMSAARAGVRNLHCDLSPGNDGLTLAVTMTLKALGGREEAVIETGDPLVYATPPRVSRKGNTLVLQTKLVHALDGSFAVSRKALRITLLGRGQAVDIRGC
ncbi:hypothetical protein KO498_08645 [Lentibacter algarum]|uniref:protein-disulfide reductase DsbD domain-containing protein n=1 Tax=Lentibacter algarum TaxID=576131 RepID=UPI001C079E06|nr:protein-disulfide reductase DsbD domain-containing protein [Lentibacter algarum]MBU2981882.1 hypothetical protein [Lentibacter algarum]